MIPFRADKFCPLFIDKGQLYLEKHNHVYQQTSPTSFKKPIINSDSWIEVLWSFFPVLRRVMRREIAHCVKFAGKILVFRKGEVNTYSSEGRKLTNFSHFNGSRPLNVCQTNEALFFGEYYSNSLRREVRIFKTNDGSNWHEAYVFPTGQVRHIHNIIFDSFRKGLWILTGDSDSESGIWFSDVNFNQVELVYGGSQHARAVSLHVLSESLVIATDTPLARNQLYNLHCKTREVTKIKDIQGSAFHCAKVKDIMFVSTVTEPSAINKTNHAAIYASKDGTNWIPLIQLRKDIFPIYLQKYTRYAEVKILNGLWNDEWIIAIGRALEVTPLGCVRWRYDDVKRALDNSIACVP